MYMYNVNLVEENKIKIKKNKKNSQLIYKAKPVDWLLYDTNIER